jgi:hypothetical protein
LPKRREAARVRFQELGRLKRRIRMKRSIACLSLVAVLAMYGSALAIPQDEYDDSQSYPLRVAAYLLNPVGVGLEYAIFRPFHWLVSYNDTTELIFGHGPHGAEELKTLSTASY